MMSLPLRGTELDGLEALDAAEAVERLAAVLAALPSCGDPQVLAALAGAMPARLSRLAPEVALALHDVAVSLAPHGVRLPEDLLTLEPLRLRVMWLRVALMTGTPAAEETAAEAVAQVVAKLDDEALLLAVIHGWSLEGLPAALPVLERLARARDPRLRAVVVQAVPAAVQHLGLTGPEAFACLAPLAAGGEAAEVRAGALRALAGAWLVGLSPQAVRRREQLIAEAARAAEPASRTAALEAARELGLRHVLVELVEDEAVAEAARASALEALGPLAEPEDLAAALALALGEPLRFGPPARRFLLEAHRHGAFVREPELGAVLELFDRHAEWRGDELVRVTYLVRKQLMASLAELPATDPRWIRRAAILAASVGSGAQRLLAERLDQLSDHHSGPLSDQPGDGDVLQIAAALVEAAGQCPEFDDEVVLLRWLDHVPEAVIPALRVKGGADAAARLREIVLDPFTPPAVHGPALDALWALAEDRPALLAELAQALGPRRLDLADRRFTSPRDSTAAEILTATELHRAEVEPVKQLAVYCEAGERRFLPEVSRLFREVLRGYVRKALEGDFTIKRLLLPELEQQIFRLGRHLIKDGRPVRRWNEAGPETGRDLVLRFVVEWLAEAPSDPICVALLEIASRHAPDGAYLRFLEPYWRKGDVNVRRAAIEALAAAPAGSHGLELSLGRLVDDDTDPRIASHALEAMKTLRAMWAEPLVRRALERPEMAVKQAAAEALAEIGTGRSVPALVRWLSRHDNGSFRESLSRALARAAGPARVAVLVEALDRLAGDPAAPRSRELIWQALGGHLRLAAVMRLARSPAPEHQLLVEACVDRRVTVADAGGDQVAAALHRARLRPLDVKRDPAQRLRTEGFSPEAALQLVAEREGKRDGGDAPRDGKRDEEQEARDEAAILAAARLTLPSWLGWLDGETEAKAVPSAGALALALDAAQAGELVPRALALAERWHPRLEPETVAAFVERCLAQGSIAPGLRLRAATLVRALAPSPRLGGLRRFRLLGKLGAVRTVADLEQELDECRIRPSGAAEGEQLLCEALAIPPPPPAPPHGRGKELEPAALTALREAARNWQRTDDEARRQWLRRAAAERPLDLPVAPPPPEPARSPPFQPASREDLEALLDTLGRGDAPERARAARRLLAWPDARQTWPRVLEAFLAGAVEVEAGELPRLAGTLARWPEAALASPEQTARLLTLIPHLPPWSARRFAARWIEQWEGGEWGTGACLRALGQERLLPYVVERVRAGRPSIAALLEPSASPAMQALVELLATHAPREAERLRRAPEEVRRDAAGDPVDPIAGKSLDELVRAIEDKRAEKGLAVRAVHALTRFAERAIEPLGRLATDRRPPVRSAALRALRAVASREHTLEVTARVLAMKTRRDVTLQLMASLGHGRHEPALPGLLERFLDRDPRIRDGARDALRAWGRDAIPAMRREARRARPDHRRQLEALIDELE